MSSDSFQAVTAKWIDDHTYVGRKDQALQVVLVAAELAHPGVKDASPVLKVDCGFGHFRVQGHYDKSKHTFDCVAAHLVVPSFGPVSLIPHVVFDLKKSAYVPVDLGDAAKGKLKIEYGANNSQVVIDYDLAVSFVGGRSQDIIPLFPTNPTAANKSFPREEADIGAITGTAQGKSLISSSSGGELAIRATDRTEGEHNQVNLLNSFLTDFVKDGNKIVIETYYPNGPVGAFSTEAVAKPKSGTYKATFHFAGILEVVASINPSNLFVSAQLFVKAPIVGRVNLTGISGSLVNGQGVKAQFNVKVASGNITLHVKKNGKKHDLYVSYALHVALVGNIKGNDFKLVTLPF